MVSKFFIFLKKKKELHVILLLIFVEFILGPILPIVNVESVNEAISVIKDGAKPLSMYIFSEKKDKVKQLIEVRILLLFSKI